MVTYRPIVAPDAATIARIHATSWRSAYRGIVPDEYLDDDIDAAEMARGARDRILDGGFVTHVDFERQRPPAGLHDVFGGGVDGAGKPRMRRRGLGGDGDVGAVARGAQRDREPDAARRAGDEEGVVPEGHDC